MLAALVDTPLEAVAAGVEAGLQQYSWTIGVYGSSGCAEELNRISGISSKTCTAFTGYTSSQALSAALLSQAKSCMIKFHTSTDCSDDIGKAAEGACEYIV